MKAWFEKILAKFRQLPLVGYYRPSGTETDDTVLPLKDIRLSSPVELARDYQDKAHTFLENVPKAFGWVSHVTLPLALPLMDRLSHEWLKKTNNPYLSEIEQTAAIVGIPGVYTMSMSYEWGCTSGVFETGPESMTLARVMDWPFPMMGDTMVVAHQAGSAGDFYSVTWPGYNGVVQAMAPGRFSATINQAPQSVSGKGALIDWIDGRAVINNSRPGVLPPPHALRKAFETASSYDEAKKMLMQEPLTSPAIFVLAGTKEGEGCVIERTADGAFVREVDAGRVTVGNMFESALKDSGDNWQCLRGDSLLRSDYLRAVPAAQIADKNGFPWFDQAPEECMLRSHFSRVVFTANAAEGTLQVMGLAGEKPVTKIFRI